MTPVENPRIPDTGQAPQPPNRPGTDPRNPRPGQHSAGAGAEKLPGAGAPDHELPEVENPQDHQTHPAVYDEPGEIGVPAEAPVSTLGGRGPDKDAPGMDPQLPSEKDNPQAVQTPPAVYDEPGEIGIPADTKESVAKATGQPESALTGSADTGTSDSPTNG